MRLRCVHSLQFSFGLCLLAFVLIGNPVRSLCQTPSAPADQWAADTARHPIPLTAAPDKAAFASLHAEALVGKLRIFWTPARLDAQDQALLRASSDAPGRWLARDWRTYPMQARGNRWETTVPIESVYVPVAYFVEWRTSQCTNHSPIRLCQPKALGLETPSRLPWPFLEGFEQGAESWQLVGDTTLFRPVQVTGEAHDGASALSITLPARKHSVTVATTRLRGWQILQHSAKGLRLWLRARTGTAKVRFTLLAHARSDSQILAVYPVEPMLTGEWQSVELLFERFPRLPLAEVDLLTVEFIGVGPGEFLIDDLELIAPGDTGGRLPKSLGKD